MTNVPTHKAIVRSDTHQILGIVGKGYNPTQFDSYFSQFHTLTKSLELNYDKGVVFEGGKKVILTATFPKSMLVRVGDECRSELNWGTSFDGSMGNNGWFTILRLVCSNGLTKKSKEQQFSCRHTKNSEALIKERMSLLLQSEKYFKDFLECAKRLNNKMVDKQMADKFLRDMFGEKTWQKKTKKKDYSTETKNNIAKVGKLFRTGKGNGQGTAWDLYNGYTEWQQHERGSNPDKRFVANIIGSSYNKKAQAFNSLLSMS